MTKVRTLQWHPILLALTFITQVASAEFAPTRPLSAHARIDQWEWTETANGTRLLKESGPLVNVGLSGALSSQRAFLVDIGGTVFAGSVDYEGTSTLPGSAPIETTTDYLGTEAWLHGKWRATPDANIRVFPLAGLRARCWTRDIKDADAINLGYEEDWRTIFASAGLRLQGDLNDEWELFCEFAYRHALWNQVEYKDLIFLQGKVLTVKPAREGSWRAATGLTRGRLTLSATYEQLQFGQSNSIDTGDGWLVWQPESKATMLALTIATTL